jgi:hypothetical protein
MSGLDASNVNALIAVCGTLLGGALGASLTYWQQLRQRQHDDAVRFHTERLNAYIALLDLHTATARNVAVTWADSEQDHHESRVRHLENLITATNRIELVGSASVVHAARDLYNALADFMQKPEKAGERRDSAQVGKSRSAFKEAARGELGTNVPRTDSQSPHPGSYW